MKPECPSCGGDRETGKYLCRGCWWLLPEPTRDALCIRDGRAIRRLQKLYGDLRNGTPLHTIEITA